MRCNVDKQNKKRPFQRQYKSIEQLLREAYGLSPEQMEKRMEWAEKEAVSEKPLGGRKIPQAPEHEFQTILSKMKERGITPKVMADFSQEQQRAFHEDQGFLAVQNPWLSFRGSKTGNFAEREINEKKEKKGSKKKLLFLPLEAAGAVAVCFAVGYAVFALRPGIDVMGKRSYEYVSEVREGDKTDIVWDNQEDVISDEGSLEEAYEEIQEELGISIIRINYIPNNMKLIDTFIGRGHVRLEFSYENNRIYMLEVLYSKDNTESRFSDCEKFGSVSNEWLNMSLPIRRNIRDDGRVEYISFFEIDNAYYCFLGVMEQTEFEEILKNLSLN